MESPDTLTQVINQLRQQGYTEDLNRHEENMVWLKPEAYQIDEVYRFELEPHRRVRRCGSNDGITQPMRGPVA